MKTLDQKRAEFAWGRVVSARQQLSGFDTYRNLAKGAPALIMSNGLMPSLAYWNSRTGSNKAAAEHLLGDVLAWLSRSENPNNSAVTWRYSDAMLKMFEYDSREYLRATDETLATLKWLRQFADAVDTATQNRGGL